MNGIRLLAAAAFVFFLALATGLHPLYFLAYVLALVTLGSLVWARLNLRGVTISRAAHHYTLQMGQVYEESLTLHNDSKFPKIWVEARDRSNLPGHRTSCVVSLGSQQKKTWRVRTVCRQRGVYRLGPVVLVTGDPFGLFRFLRRQTEQRELLVYPPILDLAAFGLPTSELTGSSNRRSRSFNITPLAAGLRQYVAGDPYNRIHWAATARQQQLMVKEFEIDPTTDIWIVLDMQGAAQAGNPNLLPQVPRPNKEGRYSDEARRSIDFAGDSAGQPIYLPPSTEEYGVALASSLAARLIAEGRNVGMISWGQQHEVLSSDRGARQLQRILRSLAVLRAQGTAPLDEVLAAESNRFGRNSTLIVITANSDEQWVKTLAGISGRGIRSAVVQIERSTFNVQGEHHQDNSMFVVAALAAANIPSYLVKRGTPINLSLSQGLGGVKVIR